MVSTAVTSLAILKVNWDTLRKDYIESFVPFVAQCIIALKSSVVSTGEVQKTMLADFGIRIPHNALTVILNRAVKQGYIRRHDGRYIPVTSALQKLDFETTRQRVLREHNAIIEKLIQFCAQKHDVIWDNDQAEKALLSFVAEHQVEILSSSVDGTSIPMVTKPDRRTDFLTNAFIIHLYESDPEGFKYLDTIVKGNMLANVLFYSDISQVQSRFERTEIYCDTGFIIHAIGLEGPRQQEPCKELLDLLYERGAQIRCFRHTLDEVRNILFACFSKLKSGDFSGYGATFQYLSDNGYTASEIELEIAGLERKLQRFRINVADKPEYVAEFQIDEKALEKSLQDEMRYGEERKRARIHDVDCLSAIFRLRKGQVCYNIEHCVALFLTTNSVLTKVSYQFFNLGLFQSEETAPMAMTAPMAITDHILTTIVWVKKPMVASDLPRKHIIAECYAALEPGDRLWKSYLSEISKLRSRGDISADESYLLRASIEARTQLMHLTMGDEATLFEDTPKQILERIKHSIKAEEAEKLAQEIALRDRTERELQEKLAQETALRDQSERELQEKLVQETTSRDQSERELQDMRNREKVIAQQRQRQEEYTNLKIETMAHRLAHWGTKITFYISAVILLAGAYASFSFTIGFSWWSYLLLAALALFLVLSLLNIVFGVTVKSYSRSLEMFLTRFIESRLKGWLLPLVSQP